MAHCHHSRDHSSGQWSLRSLMWIPSNGIYVTHESSPFYGCNLGSDAMFIVFFFQESTLAQEPSTGLPLPPCQPLLVILSCTLVKQHDIISGNVGRFLGFLWRNMLYEGAIGTGNPERTHISCNLMQSQHLVYHPAYLDRCWSSVGALSLNSLNCLNVALWKATNQLAY